MLSNVNSSFFETHTSASYFASRKLHAFISIGIFVNQYGSKLEDNFNHFARSMHFVTMQQTLPLPTSKYELIYYYSMQHRLFYFAYPKFLCAGNSISEIVFLKINITTRVTIFKK